MLDIIPRPIYAINLKKITSPKNFILIPPKKSTASKNAILENEEPEKVFVKIIPPAKSPPQPKNTSIEIQQSSFIEEQNNVQQESQSLFVIIFHLVVLCVYGSLLILIMTQIG